uniref:Carboxypeptidase regulatory-like domain-containing protein n=1 Tax=Eiseniibacteriota bacterium TaxID=2212470 RepID=A0A832I9V6_UNCEI
MRLLHRRTVRLALIAALALSSAACERNAATSLLVPTGIRPRPPVGEGAIVGQIVYDPTQAPDLVSPPYPVTAVELWLGTELLRTDTLDASTRAFEFRGLGPGEYFVAASANYFFRASLPPVRVVSGEVDVGDLRLAIDAADNPSAVHVLYDETTPPRTILPGNVRDTTGLMRATSPGLWTFPQPFSRPPTLAAGVHRMRFILNRSRVNPVNWTAARTDTIDVPAAFEDAARVEGLGTDFWVRVAAPTRFAITLDMRRRTFSMEPLP